MAFEVVKASRPSIDINIGFECQLRAYGAANYDVYVAQQLLLRARIRDLHLLRGDQNFAGQFVPISDIKRTNSASSNNSRTASPVPALATIAPASIMLSTKQQRFDTMSTEHWQEATSGMNSGQKRSLDRARMVLHQQDSNEDNHSSAMDVDNATDMEESSDYRSPLGKSRTMDTHDGDLRLKSLKIVENSLAQGGMDGVLAGNTLEDSIDSQTSNHTTGSSSSTGGQTTSQGGAKLLIDPTSGLPYSGPAGDFVSTLTTVPVNFHTGSGSSGGKTSRHRRHGHNHSSSSSSSGHSSHTSNNNNNPAAAPKVNKNPSCRLSRPGSNWVRVIPPLRGLEREFKCSWCNMVLFQLSSVIRLDIDVLPMIESYLLARQECLLRQLTTDPSLREDPEDQFLKSKSSHSKGEKFANSLMSALKKSTSTLKMMQQQQQQQKSNQPSPTSLLPNLATVNTGFHSNTSNNNYNSQQTNSHASFLPPIHPSTSTHQGGSSHQQHLMSASAPTTVSRNSMQQRQYSRSFHDLSSPMDMDVDDGRHEDNEDDEEEHARLHPIPVPLMTSRANKGPKGGFGFDFGDVDDDLTASTHMPSSKHHSSSSFFSGGESATTSSSKLFGNNNNNHDRNQPQSHQPQPSPRLLPSLDSNAPHQLNSPPVTVGLQHKTGSSSFSAYHTGTASHNSSMQTMSPTMDGLQLTHRQLSNSTTNINTVNVMAPPVDSPRILFSSSQKISSSRLLVDPNQRNQNASNANLQSSSSHSFHSQQQQNPQLPLISPRRPSAEGNAEVLLSPSPQHSTQILTIQQQQQQLQQMMHQPPSSRPSSSSNNHSNNPASSPTVASLLLLHHQSGSGSNNNSRRDLFGNMPRSNSDVGFDDSPRVQVPPTRMFEGASAYDRPRSAEKLRWLARASLLREGDHKVASVADADELASQLAFDKDPYFHVEYLEWMGREIFQQGQVCALG